MILCLSITMTHVFFFSPSDYQERMEHGRGALQPLNLFLFLEPASLFQYPHVFFFFSKCLTLFLCPVLRNKNLNLEILSRKTWQASYAVSKGTEVLISLPLKNQVIFFK